MSFTTWVRAQDAYGQFDVRKGDALREGVTLVKNYPEHTGFSGRPGKSFVNIGIAAADGYKGMTKDQLREEIERRNSDAILPEDAIEIESDRPTIAQLTKLLKDDDKGREAAAAEAAKAAGLEPAKDENDGDTSQSSDAQSSDTGEADTTTTDASTGAESE